MKTTISYPKNAFFPQLFRCLPASLRKTMRKEEAAYILSMENVYYLKANAREINETAFMGVLDFIHRELLVANMHVSQHNIQALLHARDRYLSTRHG